MTFSMCRPQIRTIVIGIDLQSQSSMTTICFQRSTDHPIKMSSTLLPYGYIYIYKFSMKMCYSCHCCLSYSTVHVHNTRMTMYFVFIAMFFLVCFVFCGTSINHYELFAVDRPLQVCGSHSHRSLAVGGDHNGNTRRMIVNYAFIY